LSLKPATGEALAGSRPAAARVQPEQDRSRSAPAIFETRWSWSPDLGTDRGHQVARYRGRDSGSERRDGQCRRASNL